MTLIADGLLLAAALAAIFYCWAVNRRLGNLQRQSTELTKKLAHLDVTVADVRSAIVEGRSLAEQERDRLGHLVSNADRLRRDMERAATVLQRAANKAPAPPKEQPPRESSLSRVKRINRGQARRDVS